MSPVLVRSLGIFDIFLPTVPSLAFLSTRISLEAGRTLHLGRERSNDIAVSDPHISRQHAILRVLPDGNLYVSDYRSVNGLFCGDERVPFAVLRPGQEFLVGMVGFRYE